MIAIACPKCKKRDVYLLTELWKGHTIEFIVDRHGEVNQNDCVQKEGDPYGVEASCRCGHVWRLKKVDQITDIKGVDPDECHTTGEKECSYCSGEMCNKCGAGKSTDPGFHCEHDCIERHHRLRR